MTIALRDHRHVHFVGIGGIGMSALARLLLAQGLEVSGSDRSPGEQVTALRDLGAAVHVGHRAEHLDGADLVVVTSAAPEDNPELRAARQRGIPVIKRSELLAAITNPRRGIAVAGTHGKTTTSALIGHILTAAGLDPTIAIGGISTSLGSNARVGGELVVVEADEYDASFLKLKPAIAVITNVEPDHLDFYGTYGAVQEAFATFARQVTDLLVVCADEPAALDAARSALAATVTYGLSAGNWQAADVREEAGRMRFTVRHAGSSREYESRLAGAHNVRNALAAVAVADALGVSETDIQSALASFQGVARRSEVVGERDGVLVIDDYAHHPTEISSDLRALRTRYARPTRAVFQPHTYSRTRDLLHEFAGAFEDADVVYLLDVYPARETDTLGISGQDLADAMRQRHPRVEYPATADRALERLLQCVEPGDLVVTMGAGDVTELAPRILEGLASR